MNRYSFLGFALFALTLGLPAQTDKAPPEAPKPLTRADDLSTQVDELVSQLGAKEYKARESADAKLRALGSKAVPFLKRHQNHKDIEIRNRVQALIAELSSSPKPLKKLEEIPETDRPDKPRKNNDRRPRVRVRSLDDFMNEFDDLFDRRIKIQPGQNGGSSFTSMTSLNYNNDRLSLTTNGQGVTLTAKSGDTGEKQTWSSESLDKFKKEHAAVYNKYKGSGIFENQGFSFEVVRPGQRQLDLGGTGNDRARKLIEELLKRDPFETPGTTLDLSKKWREEMDKWQRDFEKRMRERRRLFDPNDVFGDLEHRKRRLRDVKPVPQKPTLGVEVTLPPSDIGLEMERTSKIGGGTYVSNVLRGSLAEKIGLKVGDVIVSLNGKSIETTGDLKDGYVGTAAGGKLSFRVWRRGELKFLNGNKQGKKTLKPAEIKKLRKLEKI